MSTNPNELPNLERQRDAENRIIQTFRNSIPILTEVLLFLLVLGMLGVYLFWPWIKDLRAAHSLEPPDEDYRLDCFILRDASKSPSPEDYDEVEEQIVDYLDLGYGDRISYALFGAGVLPSPIPTLSSDSRSIDAQRQVAGNNRQIYDTTNFSFLFDQLREAIKRDRQAQAAKKRKEHVDVIIILSDGVPDLSSKMLTCPAPGRNFIPDDVVQAFEALMNSRYATQEPIYVRLVLIGGKFPHCTPNIKTEWERTLGSRGLEVVLYSKSGGGTIGEDLLRPLKRHSHIALQLHPLQDDQRRLLDQGERFSVDYSARSVGEGGDLQILSGTLVDTQQRTMELNAFKNRTIKSSNPEHFPVVSVPSPDKGEALGKRILSNGDFIYLEPDARDKDRADFLLEQSTYTLNLAVVVTNHPGTHGPVPVVDPNPPTLKINPCNQAEKKRIGRSRLQPLFFVSIVLSGIFWAGSVAWYKTTGAPEGTRAGQVNAILARTIILPYKRWFEALILLLVLMALGVFFLEEPLLLIVCVTLLLASGFFLLSPFSKSRTAHLLVRLVEFLVLPLIAEGAAHYIFK